METSATVKVVDKEDQVVGPSINDATLSLVRSLIMKSKTQAYTNIDPYTAYTRQQEHQQQMLYFLQRKTNSSNGIPTFFSIYPHEPTQLALEDFEKVHNQSQIALQKFEKEYSQWNIRSILDIKQSDKATLDLIFYQSDDMDRANTINNGMIVYQKNISNIVALWNASFREGTLSFSNIQHVLQLMKLSVWDAYRDSHTKRMRYISVTNCELPNVATLQSTLDDMSEIMDMIQSKLSVNIRGESYSHIEVLNAYQCVITDDIKNFAFQSSAVYVDMQCQLQQIDDAFSTTCTTIMTTTTTTTNGSTTMSTTSISCSSNLDRDEHHHDRSDWLHLCAYFHKYPSLLFGEMKYIQSRTTSAIDNRNNAPPGYWPNISEFIWAVLKKQKEIQETFGTKMSYSLVSQILANVFTTDTMIDTELQVLMSCEVLNLTTSDIVHFRVVKFLIDSSKQLQAFVDTCDLRKFRDLTNDKTFQALQIAVTNFYSSVHHNRDECLAFFGYLHDVFCQPHDDEAVVVDTTVVIYHNHTAGPTPTPAVVPSSYIVLLHKMDELTKVLSWLLPFTYISNGPNIWKYVVEEMEWIGNDGNMEFQEAYKKIHDTSTRYRMLNGVLMLPALESVVRLFSVVYWCADGRATIQDFLHSFQDNSEIRDCMNVPSMEQHIHEVNGQVHVIKDLFRIVDDFDEPIVGGLSADIPTLTIMDNQHRDGTEKPAPSLLTCDSNTVDCNTMRRWLDDQKLPFTVGELFFAIGIRTMDDVRLLSELDYNEINEMTMTLPKFDQMKLLMAMKQQFAIGTNSATTNTTAPPPTTTTTTTTTVAVTPYSTTVGKKRKATVDFLSQIMKK